MQNDLNFEENLKNCFKNHDESSSIPPICYSDAKILEIEKEILFKQQWICIGHVNFLKKSGDYITKEILDTPVIIIRDKSKAIRVFANVCRHRSAKLLEGKGNTRGIICPFHSWAYNLEGKLKGVPNMNDAKSFNKDDIALKEFPSEEKLGLCFVHFGNNCEKLEDQIDNFENIHSKWPMKQLVSTRERTFDVNCNWKAFLEVFNEYYHLPFVHPETIGDVYQLPNFPDKTNGSFTSQFGRTSGNGALLESEQQFALPDMPGLNTDVHNSVRYTWVFPNLTFAIGNDALWIYEVHPLGPETCRVFQTTCFPESTIKLDKFEKLSKQYYHRMDAAIDEDIPALENQQAGLRNPYAQPGRFSPLLEANVVAFANWYARKLINSSNLRSFSNNNLN